MKDDSDFCMKNELDEEQGMLVRKSTEIRAQLVRGREGGKEMGPFKRYISGAGTDGS